MQLREVAYTGPEVDDHDMLDRLPESLRRILSQANGFVAFGGGLHVRGACREPAWHSLREVWVGGRALHRRYPQVRAGDVPFAQDAVGDQWLLRDGCVLRLYAETGEVEEHRLDLMEFCDAIDQDPVETLGLHPLLQYQREGGRLEPGQLLSVYPPFCVEESRDGIDLRAIPAGERLDLLADMAAVLSEFEGGQQVDFRVQ